MTLLTNLIRPDLRANFKPYSSAALEMGRTSEMHYLNANENPYPFKGLEGLERYDVQQPPALMNALAKAYDVAPEELVATRGSDESIDLLIRMFCVNGQDSILTCPPTFAMYSVYANLNGAKQAAVPLLPKDGSYVLDVESIIKAAKNPENHVKLVFLCCPNAPTGNLFAPRDIEKTLRELEGIAAVVVDEAYIDFAPQESFAAKRAEYPNLIVLRTLSKAYALAGERVGCSISGDREFIKFMRGCLAPYPVPKSVAQNAVKALELAAEGQEARTTRIIKEKDRLFAAFSKAEMVEHVFPTVTNFLLVRFASFEAAQEYLKKAAEHHIILRDVSKHPDTLNCLRISVGNEEENEVLISLL